MLCLLGVCEEPDGFSVVGAIGVYCFDVWLLPFDYTCFVHLSFLFVLTWKLVVHLFVAATAYFSYGGVYVVLSGWKRGIERSGNTTGVKRKAQLVCACVS